MTGSLGTDHDADERAVRAVEAAYDAAWKAGDVVGLLRCLAEDAVLVNPHRVVARGHGEIGRELANLLRNELAGSKHSSIVSRVEFVTGDVAVVDGKAVVEGADPGEPVLVHGYTDVLVRKDDCWVIAHVRAYGLSAIVPVDRD